ncbi:hypothetical protein [Dokdonella sp.]|uniref:hypothetical protein n=1 Tax=Dokdonella sp. TaxID=2291710 RepID=UPI0025BB967C|nr:hypothetical protein [Dokdonella sp.]
MDIDQSDSTAHQAVTLDQIQGRSIAKLLDGWKSFPILYPLRSIRQAPASQFTQHRRMHHYRVCMQKLC